MKRDGIYKEGFVGMLEGGQEQEDIPKFVPLNLMTAKEVEELLVHQLTDARGYVLNVQIENQPVYRDDLTGQLLDPELVKAARAKELEYFESKLVWEKKAMGRRDASQANPRSQ